MCCAFLSLYNGNTCVLSASITVTSSWAQWRLKSSASLLFATVSSGAHQRKYQSSASLASVRGIHRSPVDSSHKGPVTRKRFPFDDVFMKDIWRTKHINWTQRPHKFSTHVYKTLYTNIAIHLPARFLEDWKLVRLGVVMLISLWNLTGILVVVVAWYQESSIRKLKLRRIITLFVVLLPYWSKM